LYWLRRRPREVDGPPPPRAGTRLDRIGWHGPRIMSADRGARWDARPRGAGGTRMSAAGTRPGYRLFVGVDIAATSATVAWLIAGAAPSQPITIEQTPRGFAALQQRLLADGCAPGEVLVVME